MNMKRIVVMLVLGALMACLVPSVAHAQNFKSTRDDKKVETQRGLTTGAYTGTVYEPFSSATPSDPGTTATPPTGPRKSFDVGGEQGRSSESPIGDAALPLTLMALAFTGFLFLRSRRTA